MILWIIYFIMAWVIIYQVISLLKLSDKIEEMKKNQDYWFHQYLEEKKDNEENKKIIERVKENLPF